MKILRILLLAFVWMAAITACKEEEEAPALQNKLQAKAGEDRSVSTNTLVEVDGSASTDGNGKSFTYAWTIKNQPAGSQADLAGESTAKASFTPDVAGAYVVELRIANETGESRDEVTITATSTHQLQARAGEDQDVEAGTLVELDGSASTDGSGKAFNYAWRIKSAPEGSEATLSDSTAARPTFTPDEAGDYIIELKIKNETGESTDEVTVTVTPSTQVAKIISEAITGDVTLENIFDDPAEPDYIVTGLIDVHAKLTIEPGVVMVFEEDKGLKIHQEGKLIAVGTETQRITFTGQEEEAGFWAGIVIVSSSSDNEMTYTDVKYAGSQEIYPIMHPTAIGVDDRGYLKLTHSNLEHNDNNGLEVEEGATVELSTNYFNNEGLNITLPIDQAHKLDAESRIDAISEILNYVTIMGDGLELDQEVTWKRLSNGTMYKLVEEVSVQSGLRLEEGVRLRFNPNKFFRILFDGYLIAQGSNNYPIIMDIDPEGDFRWGGLLFKSYSPDNLLEWVNIIDAGNGTPAYGLMKSAAISLDYEATGRLTMRNSTVTGSRAYGMYVEDGAYLNEFSANTFSGNEGTSLALPVYEIGKLDANALHASGNGMNAIEIVGGVLEQEQEVSWIAMADGTPYYLDANQEIDVRSGLNVNPGVTLLFGSDALLRISTGYLNSAGTTDAHVTFTGAVQESGYWKGILIQSASSQNMLDYTEVTYAGSNDMPGMISTKANVAVDGISPGKLVVKNSYIKHGAGWGIAVETGWGATINDDVESTNEFDDLTAGTIYKY